MNRLNKHWIKLNAASVAKTFATIHAETQKLIFRGETSADKVERLENERNEEKRKVGRPTGSVGGNARETAGSGYAVHESEAYNFCPNQPGSLAADNSLGYTLTASFETLPR